MEELRKQSITYLSECSDYQLSKLYEIPKFIKMVEEHTERKEWVSVADTKEEKLVSAFIEFLKK